MFKSLGTFTPSLSFVLRIRVKGACTILCSRVRRPSLKGENSFVSLSGLKPGGVSALGMLANVLTRHCARWLIAKEVDLKLKHENWKKLRDFIFWPRVCYCTCAN